MLPTSSAYCTAHPSYLHRNGSGSGSSLITWGGSRGMPTIRNNHVSPKALHELHEQTAKVWGCDLSYSSPCALPDAWPTANCCRRKATATSHGPSSSPQQPDGMAMGMGANMLLPDSTLIHSSGSMLSNGHLAVEVSHQWLFLYDLVCVPHLHLLMMNFTINPGCGYKYHVFAVEHSVPFGVYLCCAVSPRSMLCPCLLSADGCVRRFA